MLRSKFLGSMIGSALGDAIGELAFKAPSETALRATIKWTDVLFYTDDTAMAIGLAESLIALGHLDQQHLGDTFRENYDREPWRGYATGPPTVFYLARTRDVSYEWAARTLFGGQGSFGNGAAMRIAPVGLAYHNATDLYEQAWLSASVTHTHPIGVDGAAVLALAVAQAVNLAPERPFPFERFCHGLVRFARTPEIQQKMVLVERLLDENTPPAEAARQLGRGVAVHESMPFAVYAFLRHHASFEDCLFCAILNGGDRDTLGAMACAISGAYLGIEGVPSMWQGKIENHSHIAELAEGLLSTASAPPASLR